MSLFAVVSLGLATLLIIISIMYLVVQANKRLKMQQQASKVAKKAETAANRAAWEKWRKR
jgi:hypothetical protein